MIKDRGLVAGLMVSALAAVGLIFLPSRHTLLGALILGLAMAGGFSLWIRAEAEKAGYDPLAWSAAMVIWPLSLPPFLVLTRGMRGLLLAAAVLSVLFLLPFSFLAAIVRERSAQAVRQNTALELVREGSAMASPEAALKKFEAALESDPTSLQAHLELFKTAFNLDRPKIAERDFRKLMEWEGGRWRRFEGQTIGVPFVRLYTAAVYYHDFAVLYRLKAASAAMLKGDSLALAAEARAAVKHRRETQELRKEWKEASGRLSRESEKIREREILVLTALLEEIGRQAWRTEAAGVLAARLESDASWQEALAAYGLGLAALNAGKSEEGLKLLVVSALKRKDFAEPEIVRASVLLDQKRHREASFAARAGIARIVQYGTVLFEIDKRSQLAIGHALDGFGLQARGMTGPAKDAMKAAIALDPFNESARTLQKILEENHGR